MNKIIKLIVLLCCVLLPSFCSARGLTFSSEGTGTLSFSAEGTGSLAFIKIVDVNQSGSGDGSGSSVANSMSVASLNALTFTDTSWSTIYDLHQNTFTTGLNPSMAGGSTYPQIVHGGLFSGVENTFDQQYWQWESGISNGSSDDGIIVSALNCEFVNLTIYDPTGDGIEHSVNTTIQNTIFESIGGSDINTTGGTATEITNFADADGDPLFVNPASGDYHPSSGSPCIDAGTAMGLGAYFTLIDGTIITDGSGNAVRRIPIGAYPGRSQGRMLSGIGQ